MIKLELKEAIEKIHSLEKFGSQLGLDRIKILLDKLDNPQNKLKYVHVAGTNGKGSVCAMVSNILEKSEYKTGLYISPYVTEFRERIQINGEMIPGKILIGLVETTFPIVEELINNGTIITEFEYITSLAFLWFASENCDIVVLETGMGGRYDATNVIEESVVDVITPISLDHTAILGDTIEKICDEKRQIIKQKSNVVFYRQEDSVNTLIEEFAKKQKSWVHHADDASVLPCKGTVRKNGFIFQGKQYLLNLAGKHQVKNASIALAVINALRKSGFTIPEYALVQGFATVVHPGRLEYIPAKAPVILDGAHNPDGMKILSRAIKEMLPSKRIVCVVGMLKDKNAKNSLRHLKGLVDKVICTEVNNPRKLTADKLSEEAKSHFSFVEAVPNVLEAYEKAKKYADKDGVVIICGSLYLIGEIRPTLLLEACEK